MASLFGKGAHKIATQQLNLLTATVKVVAVKNTYAQDLTAHEFYSDVSAHVHGSAQTLVNKSWTAGAGKVVFDADNILFSALAAGATIEALVVYVDTGNPATSALVAYIDTVSNFPYATNGSNLSIEWDNTGNGILAI